MGGAQPLAVTMNEGVVLIVDVDETASQRRSTALPRRAGPDIDTAIERSSPPGVATCRCRSGWSATPRRLPELLKRGVPIDVVTDQTSAHDPLAYLPRASRREWHDLAEADPGGVHGTRPASMAKHVQAMVEFQDAGAEVFDYGNSIRAEAQLGGYDRAFDFPVSFPRTSDPLFAEGKGRSAGRRSPATRRTSRRPTRRSGAVPGGRPPARWITAAGEKVQFEGLPARICWLGYKERHLAGLKFNEMVASEN
jgi:urocanate hydratase